LNVTFNGEPCAVWQVVPDGKSGIFPVPVPAKVEAGTAFRSMDPAWTTEPDCLAETRRATATRAVTTAEYAMIREDSLKLRNIKKFSSSACLIKRRSPSGMRANR